MSWPRVDPRLLSLLTLLPYPPNVDSVVQRLPIVLDVHHRVHFHSLLHALVDHAAALSCPEPPQLGAAIHAILLAGGVRSREDRATLRSMELLVQFQRQWRMNRMQRQRLALSRAEVPIGLVSEGAAAPVSQQEAIEEGPIDSSSPA